MALTDSQVIDRVNKRIHNAKAKLGGDSGIRKNNNDALRDLRLEVDLIGAKRTSAPFLVFNDVHPTPCPSDLDYSKVIDIRVEDKDWEHLEWNRIDSKQFLKTQNPVPEDYGSSNWLLNSPVDSRAETNRNQFSITFENAVPYLLLRNNISDLSSAKIVQTSSLTSDGTWSIEDDATNLRLDNQRYKANSASIACDSAGAAVDVTMVNTGFTQADLSAYEDKGYVFAWVYLPATLPASVTGTWGSSDTAHWAKTVTKRHNGLDFKEGWNLLSFDWGSAPTETGAPVATAVDYFKITFTNSAATALTSYRVDEVWCRLGKEVVMDYYSKFLVKSNAGVRKEEFEASDDTVILEGQEVNLLIDKSAEISSDMLRERDDAAKYSNNVTKKKALIEEKFPSEQELEGTTYHLT